MRSQFKLHDEKDLIILVKNKETKKIIEKLDLPVRYMAGGIVDAQSFLREKIFHSVPDEETKSIQTNHSQT